MVTPQSISLALAQARATLAAFGGVFDLLVLAAGVAVITCVVVPRLRDRLRPALGGLVVVLSAGEAMLAWFHLRLWSAAAVVDPVTGAMTGRLAVPLWVESEKLYLWALIVAVIALAARRHGPELRPLLAVGAVALAAGAILTGHPFTDPLPNFFSQYGAYLSAWGSGDQSVALEAFQQMDASRRYFYNAWYMWVHPPLLFLSYGSFVASFAASVLMVIRRHSSYEDTAYRWARLGYLPLTLGMILGMPWAIIAWSGEAWWWSGKVNMSIMMWVLYTAYLHARLYLRRRGMWKVIALLALLSFVALLLTYITTYVVPGAHSVA